MRWFLSGAQCAMTSFKQTILGTSAGRVAMRVRGAITTARQAIRNPEGLGTKLNDDLAMYLMTRLPCKAFLDVGAHIGSVIAEVQRNTAARVTAIEAIPWKAHALRRKFPHSTIHACAVGETTGDVPFFVTPASGYSSLIRSAVATEIRVPLRRIDDLVTERVDLIKIDVEGAELGAMRGAELLIDKWRPTIMFESGYGESLYSKASMWDWLDGHGYGIFTPDRIAHDGPALCRDGFGESHFYPRRTNNYFAVHTERRQEVRDMARRVLRIESHH